MNFPDGVNTSNLAVGDKIGNWRMMGRTGAFTIFEDFSSISGEILYVGATNEIFAKSAEATFPDPVKLYRGHTLQEVMESDHDLLGSEVLTSKEDPSLAAVAPCIAPITKMECYSFVGTRENPDKVGVAYGGRTANFDPAVHVPAIRRIREEGKVLDGLVGGWLPALRFVYPEDEGNWSEMVMFAPLHGDNDNPRIQPVWYRVCRVEANELKWAKYFDSYPPFPPRSAPASPEGFYQDLLALRNGWTQTITVGTQVDLPDQRLSDLARHSLVRAMITRMGSFPKYGVMDRNYGGAEHDGFQDTFTVEASAMMQWGLFDYAREIIDNYFTYFVRDDGSILYRGPETGQFGRMLTVVGEYFHLTRDTELLLKHRLRIDAVTQLLLGLRESAKSLSSEDPAYGMIAGWCEADSCLEPEPDRYMLPYFSNCTEAIRGFEEIGQVWEAIGQASANDETVSWGAQLRKESEELNQDLQLAIRRSVLKAPVPTCIPAIAGAAEPPHVAAKRDGLDPQFRAYRTYSEMLYSGCLDRPQAKTIVEYRESNRDILLGIPAVYGFNSGEMGGFLSFGHAYGLIQHDFIREFLLEIYSLSAHQYTRGSWTAPETRRLAPDLKAAPYCVPAQLSVPLLLRWLLVFEDPSADILWLCKAVPRDWLEHGKTISAKSIPTRWGKVSFEIRSLLDEGRIEAQIDFSEFEIGRTALLRLRVPPKKKVTLVAVDGQSGLAFDPVAETVSLSPSNGSSILLVVYVD